MDIEEIRHLVTAAGFIFRGSIHHHSKEKAPATPPEAGETVAVRIEQVLRSTQVLRGLAGQEAFVITRHARALRESRNPILFSECVSLGQQLLLREIGHVETSDETSRQVAESIREADERPLRDRITGAELIVTGEVADSKPTESAKPPTSEHDPLWWIAHVKVKSVLKGRKPADGVEVLFASSTDRAWFNSPKLYRGTSGILLLRHTREGEVPKEVRRTAYQAADPLDLLPLERLAEVKRVIGEDRRGH